jgi:hypothetical protein
MDVYIILKNVDADTTVFFNAYDTLTEAQLAIDEDIAEIESEQAHYKIRTVVLKRKIRGVDEVLPLSEQLDAVANGILKMLENNSAGEGRVFFGPEEVLQLRGLVDKLGVIAGELTTS